MYIFDEEKDFYIPSDVIKKQVLTKENGKTLIFNRNKMNENIEKSKLPLFSSFFYRKVYDSNKIPSFSTYFDSYIKENNEILKENKCLGEYLDALKVRMSKSYVSLVRELYIRCFLKENAIDVLYNSNDDMNYDVDAWIPLKKDKYLALSIYLSSPYSNENRKHKTEKRMVGVKYIDFAYDLFKEAGACVYFPSDKSMNDLLLKIKEYGN